MSVYSPNILLIVHILTRVFLYLLEVLSLKKYDNDSGKKYDNNNNKGMYEGYDVDCD